MENENRQTELDQNLDQKPESFQQFGLEAVKSFCFMKQIIGD